MSCEHVTDYRRAHWIRRARVPSRRPEAGGTCWAVAGSPVTAALDGRDLGSSSGVVVVFVCKCRNVGQEPEWR